MSNHLVKNASAYGLPVWSADTPVTAESLNKLSEGITSAMRNLETRLSKAGGTVNGPLEVAGGLTRANNTVYDTGNKPTAADVGALPNNMNSDWRSGANGTLVAGMRYGANNADSMWTVDSTGNKLSYTVDGTFYGKEGEKEVAYQNDPGNGPLYDSGERVYSPNNLPDRARIQNENEMNLVNGFAKDDGQVYINNRDTVKPIKRYSLCNGQGTKEQAELSAKAIYEGDTRVYSPNNKPTPTAIGALYERNCFSGPLYGYYHFGNLLIQWDIFPFNTSGKATKTIYLPIAYSDTNYSVVISHYGGSLENDYTNAIKVQSLDTNWFQVKKIFSETSETISWIAIGMRR